MGKLLCEKNLRAFGVEMRAYGQKLVKFCTHTHTYSNRYPFGLTVVIVIHVLYFKKNSRPNRGLFVIMFMLGKATVKIK